MNTDALTSQSAQKVLRRSLIGLSVMLIIVAFVGIAARSETQSSAASRVPHVRPQSYDQRIDSPAVKHTIEIANEKLARGDEHIIVRLGDSVRVHIVSKGEEAKVRLSGYDIITESDSDSGAEGGFSFVADTAGSFPYYLIEEKHDPLDTSTPEEYYLGTIEVR